jgi:hypothetical protein
MAIESTNFFSFLQQTRSPIGLVDQYSLSEIYASDQDEALENLLLNPAGLNQIFGLTIADPPVAKEDIRLIGGLDTPVIESLALADKVAPRITTELSTFVRVGDDVGEPGKQTNLSSSQSDNVIVYHGGLAAKNIEYRYLDIDGQKRTLSVSTSRESLFNSQADDQSRYTEAYYPGILRVRRRGHFNELKLRQPLFIKKGGIDESPGAIMRIPTYLKYATQTSTPSVRILNAYASKNSPLELTIKINGKGSFKLGTVLSQSSPYYFGYEIRRKSDNLPIFNKPYTKNAAGAKDVDTDDHGNFDLNQNGGLGNGVECILSIYCTPSLVRYLDISGLNIVEDARDIGLIGFDNLEEVYLNNNGLKSIPTWLKVNYKTLRTLNFSGNSFWDNGATEYWDHQDDPGKVGSSTGSAPLLSATQVLSYSGYRDSQYAGVGNVDGGAKYGDYDGTLPTVRDQNDSLYANIRNASINGLTVADVTLDNGFRVFSALETLILGQSFYVRNGDFSKVYPGLTSLSIRRPANGGNRVTGLLPKIHNNEKSDGFSYDLHEQHSVGGSIKWVGGEEQYDPGDPDVQFIGQFKMTSWNTDDCGITSKRVTGGICTDDSMVGNKVPTTTEDGANKYSHAISDAATAWSEWLVYLKGIDMTNNDVAFNLAHGYGLEWKKLSSLNLNYTGTGSGGTRSPMSTRIKITYNISKDGGTTPNYGYGDEDAYDRLNAKLLKNIFAYASNWGGKLFSIKGVGGKALEDLRIGGSKWEGYLDDDGNSYILPKNFVDRDQANPEDQSPLKRLFFNNLIDGAQNELQFRPDEFESMGNLNYLDVDNARMWGVFPSFLTEANNVVGSVPIDIRFIRSRFYDLSNMSPKKNSRFVRLRGEFGGTGRGGVIIPDFETNTPNNKLYDVRLSSSLLSTYPSNWHDPAKAGKPVFAALANAPGVPEANAGGPTDWESLTAERTSVPTTFISQNRKGDNKESRLLRANTDINLTTYIRVGDRVYDAASGGNFIGVVNQVRGESGSYIIISEEKDYTAKNLWFERAGVTCEKWFNNCTNLREFYGQSCSLAGTIPKFEGNKGKLLRVKLQNNLLTKYQKGTLAEITNKNFTTKRPELIEFNLSNNPLDILSIRNIISDAWDIGNHFGTNNIRPERLTINLRFTKANLAAGTLSNYQTTEIFTAGIPANPDADPPTPEITDPLEIKFNQLGSGDFKRINILIN